MIDPKERESVRSSERWETGEGRSTGKGEEGNNTDRSAYASRSLGLWEAGDRVIVSEERGRDKTFTSKGERSSVGHKRAARF